MTEKILQLIEEKKDFLPTENPFSKDDVGITKLCQRIASDNTKVLFYVTHRQKPLCIIKIMRSAQYNENLKREGSFQEKLAGAGIDCVPKIYFEGMIDGVYVYAEQVIAGELVSKRIAKKKEEEVVRLIKSFPTYDAISSEDIADVFARHNDAEDNDISALVDLLRSKNVFLKKGLAHSDLGRPNIMHENGKIYIIDWERAGNRPLWLSDAVYFMMKLRGIRSLAEWEKKAMPMFMRYCGVDADFAKAMYCVIKLYDIYYKKYPERYFALKKELSCN